MDEPEPELEIRFLATEPGGDTELVTALTDADFSLLLSKRLYGLVWTVESLPSVLVPVAVASLPKLLEVLRNWLVRKSTRQLEVKLGRDVSIKVSNATAEEQGELIGAAIRAAQANRAKPRGRE